MSKHHVIAPPPDGLERALRDAQRRRLQTAGFSSTATALACAAFLALSATGGTDVLGQHPGPASSGGVSQLLPTTLPEEPATTTAPAEGAAPSGTGGEKQPFGTAPAPAPRPETPGTRAGSTRSVPKPQPAARPRSAMNRTGPVPMVVAADGNCSVRTVAFCSNVYAEPQQGALVVTAHLCAHGAETARLRYSTDLELDLEVEQAEKPVWRWSDGQVIADRPHTLTLESGQCWRWETTYDLRTSDGVPLATGTHRLRAMFTAHDLGGARQAETSFRVESQNQSEGAVGVSPDDDSPIQNVLGLQNSRMPSSDSSRP